MSNISKVPGDVLARKLYAEVKLTEKPTQFTIGQQQTTTFQKSIIRHYTRLGRLNEVYYYVQMELPRSLRPNAKERYFMPATYPDGFIPVFPAYPSPEHGRKKAYELCMEFRRVAVGRDLMFEVILADENSLRGHSWYRWGEIIFDEVDKICPNCGQIYRTYVDIPVVTYAGLTYDDDEYYYTVVCDCSVPNHPTERGLMQQLSAYVDGTLYSAIRFPMPDKA